MVAPPLSNVREAHQLSTHDQKFDPESLWAYLIWKFEPIFGQQISILDPPYMGLFGLSWSELSPYVPRLKDTVVYQFIGDGFLWVISKFYHWSFNTKMLTSHFVRLQHG